MNPGYFFWPQGSLVSMPSASTWAASPSSSKQARRNGPLAGNGLRSPTATPLCLGRPSGWLPTPVPGSARGRSMWQLGAVRGVAAIPRAEHMTGMLSEWVWDRGCVGPHYGDKRESCLTLLEATSSDGCLRHSRSGALARGFGGGFATSWSCLFAWAPHNRRASKCKVVISAKDHVLA